MPPFGRFAPWFWSESDGDLEPLAYRAWKYLWQRFPGATRPDLFKRIRDTDWDLLIILDACRYDTLADIAEGAVVKRAVSPVSSTPEFLSAVAETELFDDTVYVSANPQTDERRPSNSLVRHIPLYNEGWDDNLATVPAERVYEDATAAVRNGERTVAHTIQPHYPHVYRYDGEIRPVVGGLHPAEFDWTDKRPKLQALLANGQFDLEDAHTSYVSAVRHAWEEAHQTATTLSDEGYRVVVTADHGELFGEWGFVEHPVGVQLKRVIEVPWIEYSPRVERTDGSNVEHDVQSRLQSLGYVE